MRTLADFIRRLCRQIADAGTDYTTGDVEALGTLLQAEARQQGLVVPEDSKLLRFYTDRLAHFGWRFTYDDILRNRLVPTADAEEADTPFVVEERK